MNGRSAKQKLVRAVAPAAALAYRLSPGASIPHILRVLGIAEPGRRPEFYTLAALVRRCTGGGLIAECGVYRGATLLGMAHELSLAGIKDWNLIGFDSFEGFPDPAPEDALADGSFHQKARRGAFGDTAYDALQERVRDLGYERRVTLVKGYFEDTLQRFADREFILAHLDCDLYGSYKTCLDFFYPRLRPGGFMVFDEYDFSAAVYPGAQRAIDEFFVDKPEKIQKLPEAAVPRYFVEKQ